MQEVKLVPEDQNHTKQSFWSDFKCWLFSVRRIQEVVGSRPSTQGHFTACGSLIKADVLCVS